MNPAELNSCSPRIEKVEAIVAPCFSHDTSEHQKSTRHEGYPLPAACQSSDNTFYDCAMYPVMTNMMMEEASSNETRLSKAVDAPSVGPVGHLGRDALPDKTLERPEGKQDEEIMPVAAPPSSQMTPCLGDCLSCHPPDQSSDSTLSDKNMTSMAIQISGLQATSPKIPCPPRTKSHRQAQLNPPTHEASRSWTS